ncbi:hypothetical protein ACHAWF_013067, partial [Thalassiosira exigua]
KLGSASQRYCCQLAELISQHYEEVKRYLRVSRFNAHGVRKGSGTYASSATTLPPSFVAVAARGEWSMGKILDVYFKFAMGGDQYLGRLLALLDPRDGSFADLPPHWKDPSHPTVLRGIKVAFGDVREKHQDSEHDPSGLMSLLLASLVHHSPWLLSICSEYPDHPFHTIPLLDDHELLSELKSQYLTLEANEHVPLATGVPPHVEHAIAIKDVFDLCTEMKSHVLDLKNGIKEAVFEAVDEKVSSEGGVNHSLLESSLDKLKEDIFKKIESMSSRSNAATDRADEDLDAAMAVDAPVVVEEEVRIAGPFSFSYKSSCWPVPESFTFPIEITRLAAWRKWLRGSVHVVANEQWKIKPYRKFTSRELHSKQLKDIYRMQWKPILLKMMEAPELVIPSRLEQIDEAFVQSSYAIATEYLKSCYSFIFKVPEATLANYKISTWSFKIKHNHVRKHGTESDIAKLPPRTPRNNPHSTKRTYRQGERRRVRKVARAGAGKRSYLPAEENDCGMMPFILLDNRRRMRRRNRFVVIF